MEKIITERRIWIHRYSPEQLHKLLRRIERWFGYTKQMNGTFANKTGKVLAYQETNYIAFLPRMYHRDKNGFLIGKATGKEKPIYFH